MKTTELTKRQNELREEIEVMNSMRMDDDMYEYYKEVKSELKYINFLLTHPEYV
jgi:hypothetical protein